MRQYVQNKTSEEAIKESTKVVAAATATPVASATPARGARRGGRGRGDRNGRRPESGGLQGRCGRCGKQRHDKPEECVVVVNSLSCNFCDIWGHLGSVCQKRLNGEQPRPINAVVEDLLDPVTPHFKVNVKHDLGNVTMKCLADTGASATLMKSSTAAANNIKIQPAKGSGLQSLTGDPIPVDGKASITISTPSSSINTTAIVSPATSKDLLIGFKDLKRLGIIPNSFPIQACKDTDFMAIKRSLTKLFPDVLTDILPASAKMGPLMKIHLKPGEKVPFRVTTARAVPLHWVEKAEKCVNKLLTAKSIARQDTPTEWCAPAFFVLKQDGELRLVVDYTGWNKHVERPVHVFPSTSEIIAGIDPKSKYFCKLDALSGYHQVPLDEESAELTTFLLPSGRFKHLVVPMGLSASLDVFCRMSDDIVANLPGVRKLVDDILISAPTVDVLTERIIALLEHCRQHNFILSKRKFEIGNAVDFAGHVISSEGVFPQDHKLQGIRDFLPPDSITQLRSFIGMCNQLQSFSPNLSNLVSPLLPLLKAGVQWQWLPEHQQAFDIIKSKLTKNLGLHHFDSSLKITLITDASRTGLGFALIQMPTSSHPRLIQCGSRSLIPAEKNYVAIELECLAISWAIGKCSFFLKGIPHFSVITDHRPLLGTFSKPLSGLLNPRLVRFRERILDFNFSVTWQAGKQNILADALSRSTPRTSPSSNPQVVNACILAPEPTRQLLSRAAKACPNYSAIVQAITDGVPLRHLTDTHPAKQLKGEWHALSISDEGLILLEARRIYVPHSARPTILRQLHEGHCGLQKTWESAKTMFFWPGLKESIKQQVQTCEQCQRFRFSLACEPLIHTTADFPMHKVSADLYKANGTNYLIVVDCYSGYPFVASLHNTSTAAIINHMTSWFRMYGIPQAIRTDGGPQFRGPFKEFCKNMGIEHENSSAYHPQSNGHAEAAVKNIKHLILKVPPKSFITAFSAWKNTARANQPSPNTLFFGRNVRLDLPVTLEYLKTPPSLQPASPPNREEGKPLRYLPLHTKVWIQCPHTKRWLTKGTVVSVSDIGRTYIIRTESGEEIKRNRIFLRQCYV